MDGEGNFTMDHATLSEQIKALDLKVTAEGVITDSVVDYGILEQEKLRPVRGPPVYIHDIDHLEYDGTMSRLVVVSVLGTTHYFNGGFINTDDLRKGVSPEFAQAISRPSGQQNFSQLAGGTMMCPKTTSSLNAIFDILYPDWKQYMYYDELSETQVVNMALLDRPEMGERNVDDTIIAIYHEHIELRLRQLGFDISRPPGIAIKDEVFTIRIMANSRNPFREWVESLEWDGVSRIDTLFPHLFGATSIVLDEEDDARYMAAVARAWLLGAVSRMYRPTQHDIVPIFIGGQGAGKTRALRYIAGKDEWYRSTSMQMTSRELPRFLDSVRGGIVVELGEATQLENSSPEAIKQFISQDSDYLRKAYARREQAFPRHFILAATSNKTEVFTDPTGNRRFFPMMCRPERQLMIFSVDDRSVGGREVEQIWAEALVLYRKGMRPTLSREETILAEKVQDFYTRDSAQADSVENWLDDPANGLTAIGSKISRAGLIAAMFDNVDETSPLRRMADSSINKWAESTRAWVRCKPFRENLLSEPKTHRGWMRILSPNQESVRATFAMVSSAGCEKEMQWARDVVDFRRLVIDYKLKRGDEVPSALNDDLLKYFSKLGFLAETRDADGYGTYTVVWIP